MALWHQFTRIPSKLPEEESNHEYYSPCSIYHNLWRVKTSSEADILLSVSEQSRENRQASLMLTLSYLHPFKPATNSDKLSTHLFLRISREERYRSPCDPGGRINHRLIHITQMTWEKSRSIIRKQQVHNPHIVWGFKSV